MKDTEHIRQQFASQMERRGYRPKTIEAYTRWLFELHSFFPDAADRQITVDHIQQFVDMLSTRRRARPFTVHQAVYAFRLWFNTIGDRGLPLDQLHTPQRTRDIPVVLTEPEVRRILNALPANDTGLAIRLIYGAGMKLGEALRLRPRDLDFRNRLIRVRLGRQKKQRDAIMPQCLIDELRAHIRDNATGAEWLFPGKTAGRPNQAAPCKRHLTVPCAPLASQAQGLDQVAEVRLCAAPAKARNPGGRGASSS